MRLSKLPVLGMLPGILLSSGSAAAHVSEQGLVLLLPTKAYTAGGVLAVALTVVLLGLVSTQASMRVFNSGRLFDIAGPKQLQHTTSLLSLAFLSCLLFVGFEGSRDPLSNPLPLFIWTLWWIGLVTLQGVAGDIWKWGNPWVGLFRILVKRHSPILRIPAWLGILPGTVVFVSFMIFALADPAPDDPQRLAWIIIGYCGFTFAGMWLFGEDAWLNRVECFTILLNCYALLAPLSSKAVNEPGAGDYSENGKNTATYSSKLQVTQLSKSTITAGLPGWAAFEYTKKVIQQPQSNEYAIGTMGVFVLVVLACGSFDGINETFWWLTLIEINPLAFPGRSAIVNETVAGLLFANVALLVAFALCVVCGLWLAGREAPGPLVSYTRAFGVLAIGMLPIAFAYHFAHYLTAFLVNAQYAWAAASDPLHNGTDILNLSTFYVTTGFLNSHHTVHIIWLAQAGAVVVGHVLSVLLTHAIAVQLLGDGRRAVLSQIPLAVFMVLYTFLGLWLLASPRGA